jgi:hypothetical protein
LTVLLRRRDPLAERVVVTKSGFPLVAARGAIRTLIESRKAR